MYSFLPSFIIFPNALSVFQFNDPYPFIIAWNRVSFLVLNLASKGNLILTKDMGHYSIGVLSLFFVIEVILATNKLLILYYYAGAFGALRVDIMFLNCGKDTLVL